MLRAALPGVAAQGNASQTRRICAHINTAEGRYDFTQTNLQQLFNNPRTIDFDAWFAAKWNQQ